MKNSHFTTPRMLRDATLQGIGYDSKPEVSPVYLFVGILIGFIIGALV